MWDIVSIYCSPCCNVDLQHFLFQGQTATLIDIASVRRPRTLNYFYLGGTLTKVQIEINVRG